MIIEKIKEKDNLSQSANIVENNINKLKALFPEIVTEGKIDFKVLQQLLGEELEEEEEYYRFTWAGKSQARREAHKPSTGSLRPAKEESLDWDTTQNMYIEGDNLEVLKLLQKSYAGKIKMIYIDPPYNTGKDFVYKDNYKDNLKNYQEVTGQIDSDGNKISTNSDSDGRYHSNWLNMMYPRLRLARNLLKDDGVIFMSIDDNEVDNLLKIGNELFGESNFVANIIWLNKEGGGSSDSKHFRVKREFIVCYAKNKDLLEIIGNEITNEDRYTSFDEFVSERGYYYLQKLGMGSIQYSSSLDYEIECPDGSTIKPAENNSGKRACWRWSKDKFNWGKKNGFIEIKKDSKGIWTVYTKQYLKADNEGNVIHRTQRPYSIISQFSSTQASKHLDKLNLKNYFDYSKPIGLLQYLIKKIDCENEVVLDFFSGSASTAEAVISQNILDAKNRKFIMIQLPESTPENSIARKNGFTNIAQIGRERIKISIEKDSELIVDKGFKVFKLDSSNIKSWDGNPENLNESLFDAVGNIKTDRTEEDVLYEILLKYGLDLTLPIEERIIEGKKVFNVGLGSLFICLSDDITAKVAEGIGQWKEACSPEICRVIFKDNGFTDVEKTNSVQTLKRYGINEIRSI